MRSDILDALFLPGRGASLHVLKVEIGVDGDTTQGSEQAHQHSASDTPSFDRGYEIWLMTEARKRNPTIHLSGLLWGTPAFAAASSGSIYSDRTIAFVQEWLEGLARRGLVVDSVGSGYNEHPFDVDFMVAFAAALRKSSIPSVRATKILAPDDFGNWDILKALAANATLRASVDIVTTHCTSPINGRAAPPANWREVTAAIIDSEQHLGIPDPNPVPCWEWEAAASLAQTINQNWVGGSQSGTWIWTPIYSWYDWISYAGKGLFGVANTPWSGHYQVTDTLHLVAHTSMFTALGWTYFGGQGSGAFCTLSANGLKDGLEDGLADPQPCGSYVAYLSPDKQDVTVVIETFVSFHPSNSSGPHPAQQLTLQLTGDLAKRISQLQLVTSRQGAVFVNNGSLAVGPDGRLELTIPANEVWTLSSLPPRHKLQPGFIPAPAPMGEVLLPFTDTFDDYPANDSLPQFWSDMNGAFAVMLFPGAGGHMRQLAVGEPVATHTRGDSSFVSCWGEAALRNYSFSIDFRASVSPTASSRAAASKGAAVSPPTLHFVSHAGAGQMPPSALHTFHAPAGLWLDLHTTRFSLTAGPHKTELASGLLDKPWGLGDWLTLRFDVVVAANGAAGGTVGVRLGSQVLVAAAAVPTSLPPLQGALCVGHAVGSNNDNLPVVDFDNFLVA